MINMRRLLLILSSFISQRAVVTFSSLDLTHAEDIQIVYPEISDGVRYKRSIEAGSVFRETKFVKLGNWFLELDLADTQVAAPDLQLEWINSDGSIRAEALRGCRHSQGVVRGLEDMSRAALSVCGESVTAYVDVKGLSYFLEPLNTSDGSHVLYTSSSIHRRARRSITDDYYIPESISTKQWLYNLTGDMLDFRPNKRENGDNDVENNKNPEDGPKTAGDEFPRGGNTSHNHSQPWYREQILGDDKDGYLLDSAWTTNDMPDRKRSGHMLPPRWMEIAVAVDHTLISFHGRDKVEQYVLSLMNIVSAIYQDPSLEANLRLVVTRLLLYEHKKHGIVRPGHSKKSLTNVNNWNKRLHSSIPDGEPRHDLAVWLTRSDIGGPSGYAPVAGVCDPERSCALTRDEGLTSAFIIAHETAHLLGLSHDGDTKSDNNCDDEAMQGSIMAPMVSATFNKFSWSECSRREFRKHSRKWTCLMNAPAGTEEITLNATLQTSFTMDEQCRMEFGEGYGMCRAMEIIEPCSHLWCGHEESPLVCKTKKGPPLEGTECGFGRWCVNGYCEEISNKVGNIPIVLNPQDGGWGEFAPWGPCSRTCGNGVQFRSRECNNPEPSYGGKYCSGEREEWRICRKDECPDPLVDLRAQQCKQLPKLVELEDDFDNDFTWLPYESDDKSKKCKFICINAEKKQTYAINENLLDGTPCSYEEPDSICVQGKCYVIGCDGNLNSKLRRDGCGICGGNNTECSQMNKSFVRKLKREVSRVSVLPRMARQINIEVNVSTQVSDRPVVAIVLKNRRKKRYTVTIPNTIIHTKILEGAKFSYKKIDNKHMIWSKGPLHAEMVVLIVVPQSDLKIGTHIRYRTEYTIHKDYLTPSKRYVWLLGGWGPCSASCDGGTRRETTACWDSLNKKIVKRNYCSLLQKPKLAVGKCNTFGCHFQWLAGPWESCTASCGSTGVQDREIYCVPNSVLNLVLFENNGTVNSLWNYMVSPDKCPQIRPAARRNCNRKPCPAYFVYGEWSQCSSSCNSGFQSRTFHCPESSTGEDFDCSDDKPFLKRECIGGNSSRHLCKVRKQKCSGDQSQYCSFGLLQRYCQLNGFRKMCCKSCRNYNNNNYVL